MSRTGSLLAPPPPSSAGGLPSIAFLAPMAFTRRVGAAVMLPLVAGSAATLVVAG